MKKIYFNNEYFLIEKSKPCVMCEANGNYIAPETNEVLCEECARRNSEARSKK